MFTREYFLEELLRFRELMGTKSFWDDLDKEFLLPTEVKCSRAMYGLLYVYLNTPDLTDSDKGFMKAASIEYDRRLAHMLCRTGS